jgi:hypothetical protein
VDQQDVVVRVALVLAAITAHLRQGSLGACDAPCGPIVPNRGEAAPGAGAAAGRSDVVVAPSVGTSRAAASASATPRRGASSVKDRGGISPRVERRPQPHHEAMNPLMRLALAPPEPPPLHHVQRIGLQRDQEKH